MQPDPFPTLTWSLAVSLSFCLTHTQTGTAAIAGASPSAPEERATAKRPFFPLFLHPFFLLLLFHLFHFFLQVAIHLNPAWLPGVNKHHCPPPPSPPRLALTVPSTSQQTGDLETAVRALLYQEPMSHCILKDSCSKLSLKIHNKIIINLDPHSNIRLSISLKQLPFFSKLNKHVTTGGIETLKQAKSRITVLTTAGPATGSLQRSPRTPDGRLALGRQAAREDAAP